MAKKIPNGLVFTMDKTGSIAVHEEDSRVVSTGQILLHYTRFKKTDVPALVLFPPIGAGVTLDPAQVYPEGSKEEQFTSSFAKETGFSVLAI